MSKSQQLTLFFWLLLISLPLRPSLADNVPLLLYAVCKQDREIVEIVLKNEGYSDEQTHGSFDMTALDLAIKNGLSDIAHLLMAHGAEPSWRTLYYTCSRSDLSEFCRDFPHFEGHEECNFLRSGESWTRQCVTPEQFCRQILD